MESPADVKHDMKAFYAAEARERDTDAWIRHGGSVRVPESRASHYFIDRKVQAALDLAELGPQSRVLEVGSSFGHMTFLLTERFREVVAVDLSSDSIALAERRARHYGVDNVRFLEADAEQLTPFAEGDFDGVFSFSTLRFCPHPERALAEMVRVARPGGNVVVDVPNRNCPWYGPLKRAIGVEPHIHDRLFAATEIVDLMRSAGLDEVRFQHILFTSKRAPDGILPLCRLVDRIGEWLPGIRGWSGIIMAGGRKRGER